jgi:ParB-like chromosome segregation protein Spo0J
MPIEIYGNPTRSNNIFNVPPADIIVREELRGRYAPPSEEAIIGLAISIKENGQIEACRGSKIKHQENRIELTAGFSRFAAVQLLREGFDFEGIRYHVPAQLLKVEVSSGCEAIDALKMNIAENKERNQTSAIDDAANIRRLEKHGMTLEEIAKFYRWPFSKVEQTVSLLSLSEEDRMRVHLGIIPFSGALALLTVAPEDRPAIIEEATGPTSGETPEKVKGTAINRVIRERHLTNNPEHGQAPTKVKNLARTYSEVKEFLQAESVSGSPRSKSLASTLLEFAAGTISQDDMKTTWDKLLSR